jgi:hypothetical protein
LGASPPNDFNGLGPLSTYVERGNSVRRAERGGEAAVGRPGGSSSASPPNDLTSEKSALYEAVDGKR